MRLGGLDWRTVRSSFVLSLPTLVVVGVGCYFLASQVPSIVKNEQLRVRSVYRLSADELRTSPETGFPVIRGKGQFWTKDMKLRPGYWGTVPAGSEFKTLGTVPKTLGTVPENVGTVPGESGKKAGTDPENVGTVPNGMMLVWYEGSKGNCVAKFVKSEKEYDYFRIFWLGVPIFLFVLCGMTFIGIRYFVEYIKARDDFLAATAHDLTTPLVGMRMSIGRSDADAKALNERLIRIVENIKDFMRLGGKRREPEISEFDIIKAYNEAYALFREDYRDLFDGEDVPVEVMGTVPENVGTVPQKAGTVPGGRVLKVRADETMTVQMMWNLLGNDLKYAAPYGSVRVRFFVEGKFVKAEFVDEGQGMTPRQMRRAFDRYYRAKTVLESGKGGFGIGLCTAREFARAMGGDLSVRANSPHGCIFTLSLPAAGVS